MTVQYRSPCDEAVIRSGPSVAPCARSTGRWVLAATIIASSLAFIDTTVVNVVLPVLQREIGATVAQLQWVVESYALFLAALILVGGVLGDRYGRKRILALGTTVFAASSVWCGLADGPLALILARAVQGVGAALLVPNSLALISATFDEEQRGKAIGTWSGLTALTMALGPVLGGWLADNVSWRWIFFINIPPAVAVVWILMRYVPESRDEATHGSLDWPGAGLATVGLGLLIFGLIEGGSAGFSEPLVALSLVGGVGCLAVFLIVESRHKSPMVPLAFFRSPSFSGANIVTVLLYAALGGALFFLPFNLIQVQGYNATEAGAALLPLVLILFALSRWSGGLIAKYGGRLPLIIGPMIAAVGFAMFTLPGVETDYWSSFFPAIVVLGLGMAVTVAPLTTLIMTSVDPARSGTASGINNAVSRVAVLVAIAVLGIVLLGVFNTSLDAHLDAVGLPAEFHKALDGERVKLAGALIPEGLDGATAARVQTGIYQAFVAGFRWTMGIGAALALLGAFTAAVMIRNDPVEADKTLA